MADEPKNEPQNEDFEPEEEPEIEEEDLDFEEGDEDLMEKEELAQKVKELNKKLSTAIKQKRKWRERALKKETPQKEEKKEETPQIPQPTEVEKMIEAKLQEKEIEGLDVPDKVKEEIRRHLSAGTFKSVKEAVNSPYIQFLVRQEREKEKAEKASISPTHKGEGGTKRDFSEMSPKDFDLSTPEGRKEFEEYKKWLKTQG